MKQYVIIKDNQKVGPLPIEQLVQYGLQPDTFVWTEGMADWMPANQVPELMPLFAPAAPAAPISPAPPVQQPMAPQQPMQQPMQPQYQQPMQQPYQQPIQQPYQQQPYQQPGQPANNPLANISALGIPKILMFIVLGFAAIMGLIFLIKSFDFIDYHVTAPGVFLLFSGLLAIAIPVIIILRILKNQNYGFLALSFFITTFLFGLLNLIIVGGAGMFIFMLIVGLLGIGGTIYATTPMDRLADPKRYMEYIGEATMIDYILAGAYFLCSLLFLITMASFMSKVKSIFK